MASARRTWGPLAESSPSRKRRPIAVFQTPKPREKSGAVRGDRQGSAVPGKSARSARPSLELLESRLLLSGDLRFDPSTSQDPRSGPMFVGTAQPPEPVEF